MQLKAIRQCLKYEPDIIVLPELRHSCIPAAAKLFASKGYILTYTRVRRIKSLGVASRIPASRSEVINQGPFAHRPQLKLQLENGITFLGIHLDAPLSPHRYRLRRRQLSQLAQLITQAKVPTALAGDFNSYFNESIFQAFLTQIGSPHYDGLRQRPHTWPSVLPLFQIDHILCSQQLKVTQLQQGHFNGSDHLPIYACVNFRTNSSNSNLENLVEKECRSQKSVSDWIMTSDFWLQTEE